jgi:hypothetical protein
MSSKITWAQFNTSYALSNPDAKLDDYALAWKEHVDTVKKQPKEKKIREPKEKKIREPKEKKIREPKEKQIREPKEKKIRAKKKPIQVSQLVD